MLLFTAKLSVTSSVPATLVSPVVLDTVNMLDPTFTSASMSTLPVVNVIVGICCDSNLVCVEAHTFNEDVSVGTQYLQAPTVGCMRESDLRFRQ